MDDYGKLINKQYKQLLEQCKIQMDRFERDYPEPREGFPIAP